MDLWAGSVNNVPSNLALQDLLFRTIAPSPIPPTKYPDDLQFSYLSTIDTTRLSLVLTGGGSALQVFTKDAATKQSLQKIFRRAHRGILLSAETPETSALSPPFHQLLLFASSGAATATPKCSLLTPPVATEEPRPKLQVYALPLSLQKYKLPDEVEETDVPRFIITPEDDGPSESKEDFAPSSKKRGLAGILDTFDARKKRKKPGPSKPTISLPTPTLSRASSFAPSLSRKGSFIGTMSEDTKRTAMISRVVSKCFERRGWTASSAGIPAKAIKSKTALLPAGINIKELHQMALANLEFTFRCSPSLPFDEETLSKATEYFITGLIGDFDVRMSARTSRPSTSLGKRPSTTSLRNGDSVPPVERSKSRAETVPVKFEPETADELPMLAKAGNFVKEEGKFGESVGEEC